MDSLIKFTSISGNDIYFSNGRFTGAEEDAKWASDYIDSVKGQIVKVDGLPLQLSYDVNEDEVNFLMRSLGFQSNKEPNHSNLNWIDYGYDKRVLY